MEDFREALVLPTLDKALKLTDEYASELVQIFTVTDQVTLEAPVLG